MFVSNPTARRISQTLDRLMRVDASMASERRRDTSNSLRVMRLNALYLRLKKRLRDLDSQRAVRAASAPRFSPALRLAPVYAR